MQLTGKLSLVVLVFLAVIAMAPAAASADGLCKANESPCESTNLWPAETILQSQIKPETEVVFRFGKLGKLEVRCTGSTWSGELTGNSGQSTVLLKGLSETYSGCQLEGFACNSVKASEFSEGAKWFASTEVAGDGYTRGTHPLAHHIVATCAGLICKWELPTLPEPATHTYAGGAPALESWSTPYIATEGSPCGEALMSGEREFSSPEGNIFWTDS